MLPVRTPTPGCMKSFNDILITKETDNNHNIACVITYYICVSQLNIPTSQQRYFFFQAFLAQEMLCNLHALTTSAGFKCSI